MKYDFLKGQKNYDIILILHGWRGSKDSWKEVGNLLNQKGYNIFIPDIPCASKNLNCNKIFNLDDYAKKIEDFILEIKNKYSYLNFDNLILWGHSNGGAISIKLSIRKNIKILRLVLNNSAGIRLDKKRTLKRKFFKSISNFLSPFFRRNGNKFYKKLRVIFYKIIGGTDYLEAEKNINLKKTYLNMINSDLKEDIKKIENHTLLIWGEKDSYTPVTDAYFMRENIKKSKLVILDGETHGIHLKNPKRLVNTFIENI